MAKPRCAQCGNESIDTQTTTRAHSIPCVNEDGTKGRFYVVLCMKCFNELEAKHELDSFAHDRLAARPSDLLRT